jgi:hypothetical protein
VIVRAVVKKLKTEDGLVSFSHTDLGKVYLVDLDTIRRGQTMAHYHSDDTELEAEPLFHEKDIIWTIDGGWIPLELVDLVV